MNTKELGDYLLLDQMGKGALGDLFLAEHRFLKRLFTVKILPEELTVAKEFIGRFEDGVSSLSCLDHPNLVKVHNVSFAEGKYFIVSDAILNDACQSMNLIDFMAGFSSYLQEEVIFQIACQLASALEYLHDKGFAHRGIKLSNVLLKNQDGELKVFLSDAGLSKIIGEEAISQRCGFTLLQVISQNIVQRGERFGTLIFENTDKLRELERSFLETFAFMAPEQGIFSPKQELSAKVDTYAFGRLIYFLLMKKFPEGYFDLPSSLKFYKYNWDELICRCLIPDPEKRPSLSLSFVQEIEKINKMNSLEASFSKEAAANHQRNSKSSAKPHIKPSEIERPQFEPEPGAIFQTESIVMRYQPAARESKNIEPIITEMVIIPGGCFFRGSSNGGRDEMPRHHVNLFSFAIDIHPVTNEQFVCFLEAMGGEKDVNNNDMIRLRESRIKRSSGILMIESGYAKHPVVGVTWYGATAYAKWVGKRLPTEAEWEIAACGGLEDALYPSGKNIERSHANFFSSDTTAVMSYPPNGYNLYDMAGNVYEWCQDWYDYHYYNTSVQEPDNPKGPLQGVYRVLRGGCWKSLKEDLRCSHRHRNNPGTMNGTYGFRCATDVLTE